MNATATDLAERTLGRAELRRVTRRIGARAHATVGAHTRTRRLTALASVSGEGFELLMPSEGAWRLISGRADRLGGELVGLVTALERLTGTAPTTTPAPAAEVRPLAPGELLALTEVIRQGDTARLAAAVDELTLPGMPWWVRQFAWGAEAVLTLHLTGDGVAGFATMLHLLPDGWGCLQTDGAGDLTFHPMTTIEVQARVSAFAALLHACSW